MTTNFDPQLQVIAQLRETKGKESETLAKIAELEMVAGTDFTIIAKLNWEKAFVYQHLVMGQTDVGQNLKLMAESALKAHEIVEQNNLAELKGDDYRFLGRIYDYQKNYPLAQSYYQQALDFYTAKNDPHVLEIKGFLSYNLVCQNKIDEGMSSAEQTFTEFDQNSLKQSDYYTWAVWKSGIFPRIIQSLSSQKADFDKVKMADYLAKSEAILTNNYNFQFRLDEIAAAKNLLN
ncbi:MAG: hypothetical protein NTY75_02785 [Candidatus Shapirobacteria bacterium]|nr:hypothetical protein [Candidatus Shapirobacteria bacterium]